MWLIIIILFGFPLGTFILWDEFKDEFGRIHSNRIRNHGWFGIIKRGIAYIFGGLLLWIVCSICAIFICEIICFIPLAFSMFIHIYTCLFVLI